MLKYSALHMVPFVFSTTQFWVYFCQDSVTFTSFSSTLSGMLAHCSSNRFIQRPNLVVFHVTLLVVTVSSTLVVGSSVDVF